MNRTLLFLLSGFVFGTGLVVSGMTNPAKVQGFLDLFGGWDPSLAFVMLGAIATYGAGRILVLKRPAPLLGGSFPKGPARKVEARVVVGSSLFGIGWGLVGLCPGPAVTNLGGLHPEIAAFVAAMAAGMLVARHAFGVDR